MLKFTRRSAKEDLNTTEEQEMDLYSSLTGIESQLDSLILTYKSLKDRSPEWERVLDSLVSATFTQKGHVQVLKDSLAKEDEAGAEENGEEMAKQILNDPCNSFAPLSTDDKIVSLIIGDSPVTEDIDDETSDEEDYLLLVKESDDLDEAFLEYHYTDELQAQGSFFNTEYPAALFKKEGSAYNLLSMNAPLVLNDNLSDILDEQVALLNGEQ